MFLSTLIPVDAPSPEALVNFYAEKKAMNYAMVQSGIIINVIEWDGSSSFAPPSGCELHQWSGRMDIGWAWVNGEPVDPNPPPPPSVPASGTSTGPTVI